MSKRNKKTYEHDDALHSSKVGVTCILVLHPLLIGLFLLLERVSDVTASFNALATASVWSLCLGPVALLVLLLLSYVTRRAVYVLSANVVALVLLDADIILVGAFMVAEGAKASGETIRWMFLGAGMSHALLIALVEWKVARQVWQRSIDSGRIDLVNAIFDPRVPVAEPANTRSWLWQIPLSAGPVVGVLIANILKSSASPNMQLLIGGCIVLPGSLLITYGAWGYAVSLLVRTINWQFRTHRIMRIPAR